MSIDRFSQDNVLDVRRTRTADESSLEADSQDFMHPTRPYEMASFALEIGRLDNQVSGNKFVDLGKASSDNLRP
jgi:hypothetical protein